ncbi:MULTISPECIES: NAD(P)/FAD-dependent oxidoreductase [Anaerococcus]|jgi:fad dependent oxidoreductase|uniref:NAD(P)/FAD-dependent oxidoreductase n=2 Tax=Peptoniphilaceae TaxID=1570339 RepID=UPI001AEA2008|nr:MULTISPECIES: NAD(P)/FAD-dependent oxidoreductase [Anaerococcus]MBP2069871.1 putative FAD-dependent dehydrogenase [Anaerococcus nagyae]MDU2565695.1 NAD(P)/FAD-dependent oxidoreductase [Anaerococcus sp.]MDU3211432.1 NAD(P)/FAD-dependent oxidoreductase [Anaerococcus sp.]
MKNYDVIVVGSGAAGAFMAYEFKKLNTDKKVLVIDAGRKVAGRICPITEGKVDHCIGCEPCNIMYGFGGAGTLSDGKYNITNNFGGDLHQYIGEKKAMELMEYVDSVLMEFDGGNDLELYSTDRNDLKTKCLQHDLHLLDARVRHFGTERNKVILQRIYDYVKDIIDFKFMSKVVDVDYSSDEYAVKTDDGEVFSCKDLVLAAGRSGSKWISKICDKFNINTKKNRVDIGVRVEVPAEVFKHITDDVYEAKIMYQTKQYNDIIRTFCMNPYGHVVTENTNGILTVNGHSYTDPALQTNNTNFALLVTNRFTEPFEDSNEYGESIARLSNMLGGGVLMQRFGDLVKGRRSSERRMAKSFTTPTLNATAGDLSLVMPKRQLDDIIEMIYQLDKIAPGMANDDTLLYGIEVKFYNSVVDVNERFETSQKRLYCLGDGSGVTHSLSQASASGVEMARIINGENN